MHFGQPSMLLLLGVVPGFLAAFAWGDRKRQIAQQRFGSPSTISAARRQLKRICILTAAVSLILALSRPTWQAPASEPTDRSGDVVFLLDVSRSMLARDASPTRLARAKTIIASLAKELRGERTALAVFAGVPSVQCPLTIDEAFFQTMLDDASPESVARGGTKIGDAIQFSLDSVFDDVVRARKQLVIVSDGGDQDTDPAIAARAALTRGIRILVIGVGDVQTGALVPASASDPTPIVYNGEQVRTRLESGVLQAIAAASTGTYRAAGTGPFDAAGVAAQILASASPSHARGQGPASSWLILFAAVLLTAETLLSDRKMRAAALAAILIADLSAQSAVEWVEMADAAARDSHWSDAIDNYELALGDPPVLPETYFNLGLAYYHVKRYAAAAYAFGKAAAMSPGTPLETKIKLGQANCAYREAMVAAPVESQLLLRAVLGKYEELSEIPDAKFNAEVVRRRLADLQQHQQADSPPIPSAKPKASTARDIVRQAGVPGKPVTQRVDKDW